MIRMAGTKDLDALLRIEETFSHSKISRRSFRRLIDAHSSFLVVVEKDGVVIGYASLQSRSNSRITYLHSLAIDPAYRKRGYGLAVLDWIEPLCRPGEIRLHVEWTNYAAINLYVGCGYRVFGVAENHYPNGAHALRLRKELPR